MTDLIFKSLTKTGGIFVVPSLQEGSHEALWRKKVVSKAQARENWTRKPFPENSRCCDRQRARTLLADSRTRGSQYERGTAGTAGNHHNSCLEGFDNCYVSKGTIFHSSFSPVGDSCSRSTTVCRVYRGSKYTKASLVHEKLHAQLMDKTVLPRDFGLKKLNVSNLDGTLRGYLLWEKTKSVLRVRKGVWKVNRQPEKQTEVEITKCPSAIFLCSIHLEQNLLNFSKYIVTQLVTTIPNTPYS